MNPRFVSAICLFLVVGFAVVNAGEYNESPEPYSDEQFDEKQPEQLEQVVEDHNTNKSALAHHNESDPDAAKNKGHCHWGIAVWFKPGFQIKCHCMRCTCQNGGRWDCRFHFAFCPYYYCGNEIYNPHTHICCCGKVHAKKPNFKCCGYFYYNTKAAKCCNYYSVKPVKAHCPRDKI